MINIFDFYFSYKKKNKKYIIDSIIIFINLIITVPQ